MVLNIIQFPKKSTLHTAKEKTDYLATINIKVKFRA